MARKGQSMKDKFTYHVAQSKDAKFAKGEKMTPREKAIYSQGWLKHAKQSADIFHLKRGEYTSSELKKLREKGGAVPGNKGLVFYE